jgi:cysteinyl-tRNA synthetase
VDGKKMSKSLGNFFTLRDLMDKGIEPMAVRWVLLSTHYRQPNNFTMEAVEAANQALNRIRDFHIRLKEVQGPGGNLSESVQRCEKAFRMALDDDLNISGGIAAVFDFIRDTNKLLDDGQVGEAGAQEAVDLLAHLNQVTGLFAPPEEAAVPQDVLDRVQKRQQARRDKDFALSDTLRDELLAEGWVIEDTPDGPRVKRA